MPILDDDDFHNPTDEALTHERRGGNAPRPGAASPMSGAASWRRECVHANSPPEIHFRRYRVGSDQRIAIWHLSATLSIVARGS